MAHVILHKPAAGEVVFINPTSNDHLSCTFEPEEAQVDRQGTHLILSFDNASQSSGIILADFYSTYTLETMPEAIFDIILLQLNHDVLLFVEQDDTQDKCDLQEFPQFSTQSSTNFPAEFFLDDSEKDFFNNFLRINRTVCT